MRTRDNLLIREEGGTWFFDTQSAGAIKKAKGKIPSPRSVAVVVYRRFGLSGFLETVIIPGRRVLSGV